MPSDSFLSLYRRLLRMFKSHSALHVQLVDAYSLAEAIMFGSAQLDFIKNDYLHFCYAKSARSFEAEAVLIGSNFRDDSFILLRTVYENYFIFGASYEIQGPWALLLKPRLASHWRF